MSHSVFRYLLPVTCYLVTSSASAQQRTELTVDHIMQGPELVGTSPSQVRFSDDSRWVWFRWRRPGADTAEAAYRVPAQGGDPERVDSAAADTLYPQNGPWSLDRRLKLYVQRGDLWLFDAERAARRRLTRTPATESNPAFSPDGRTAYFVRDNNLYALALGGEAMLRQLTDIRRGTPPRPALTARDTTGQRGFLRAEQRRLFEFIRRPPPGGGFGASAPDSTAPRAIWLAENQTVGNWSVSADERWLLVGVSERATGALVQEMPVWVTASGYLETPDNRTKVGDEQATTRAAIIELATGTLRWIEHGLATPADVQPLGFSPTAGHALLSVRTKNNEERHLVVVDVPGFAQRTVDVLRDSAWVGQLSQPAGWLADGRTIWFASERTGWAHLYSVPASGGEARPITDASGRYEVRQIALSPDQARFQFHSNMTHFGEQHFYSVATDGSGLVQLTSSGGREDVVVSPDGRTLAVLHSTSNQPPELYLQASRAGARWRQVTTSTTEAFRRYQWRVPELVMVEARDGARVPARFYRPAHPNGAAVIFVHGAGYAQNAPRFWSTYYREYMFHHLLADRGYAVLDMDYRGSAGLGRDWRTAIYRFMGGLDLTDHVDGARWLVRNAGVDSSRIGIYGGSYGGFITLMGMFTTPGIFAAGAALRPVTDWAHYNHGYTSNILNEPQHDSIAYRRSSPIYHAEGLRGALLIAHGMVDDNVNFQDAVRLVQRLIELRKENWELAVYPVEPHGFRMAASWADEYKRILRLFELNLRPGLTGDR